MTLIAHFTHCYGLVVLLFLRTPPVLFLAQWCNAMRGLYAREKGEKKERKEKERKERRREEREENSR
jgi:hypothetical protein